MQIIPNWKNLLKSNMIYQSVISGLQVTYNDSYKEYKNNRFIVNLTNYYDKFKEIEKEKIEEEINKIKNLLESLQ